MELGSYKELSLLNGDTKMTTPTKEQVEYMQHYLSFLLGKEVAYQFAYNIIQEWEKIKEKTK